MVDDTERLVARDLLATRSGTLALDQLRSVVDHALATGSNART
jgi:hypothetical protein